MRNLAEKWAVVPDWHTAVIEVPGLAIRSLSGLNQLLVSGDLEAWSQASGISNQAVGGLGRAEGGTYTVRLARDRLLVVSARPCEIGQGWHEGGFGVTTVGAGLHVFEAEGAGVDDLVARATTLDPRTTSAGAAVSFAGINAIVYRHGDRLRVHVDRGLATYFWTWAATASDNIASAKA